MKRNGNNKHFGRSLGRKLCDGASQQLAQFRSDRSQALVLECMNQLAHPALIGTVCNGPYKGGRREAASPAELGPRMSRLGGRGVKSIAAALTRGFARDGNFHPASRTNWRGGELRQEGAADGARGGKDDATYSIKGTSKHAGHCAPSGNL